MNSSNPEIQNDLEQKLADTLAGKTPVEFFMKYLLNAQIFMPVRDASGSSMDSRHSSSAQPLVVEDDDGADVLILFTSPARAKEFVAELHDFQGGMLTEFSWVLRRLQGPMNISLNPGEDIGLDLDTEMVADLISSLPKEN